MDVSPNNLEFTGMYIWIMFGLIGKILKERIERT